MDFARTHISLDRPLLSYSKVQWLISALVRNRRIFMNLKTKGLVLDVGCGPNFRPSNLNLDYEWQPGIDICCDITRGLPLPDGYVRGIFSEHCLEHISFGDAQRVLSEFHRVLMPGGIIRIIIPDLEIYALRYVGGLPIPYGAGDATPGVSVNRIFFSHGHRFIYDFATLSRMLSDAGFVSIQKRSVGEGDGPLLDTPSRAIESLYVEAKKSHP